MPVFLRALCPLRNPSVKHVLEIFMKGLSIHSKQRGFTLIEVGIALAIGLVIMLGVARAIQVNQERSQVAQAVQDVQAILQASVDYRGASNAYTGVTMDNLNTNGLLPKGIAGSETTKGTGTNPWAGNYTAAPKDGDASKHILSITVTNVPTTAGLQLKRKLDAVASVSITDKTVTVEFG